MSVYVLCQGWDYEGEAVVGVYESLAAARRVGRELDYCDAVLIYRIRVGDDPRLREAVDVFYPERPVVEEV